MQILWVIFYVSNKYTFQKTFTGKETSPTVTINFNMKDADVLKISAKPKINQSTPPSVGNVQFRVCYAPGKNDTTIFQYKCYLKPYCVMFLNYAHFFLPNEDFFYLIIFFSFTVKMEKQ